jgi:hypothetical protein
MNNLLLGAAVLTGFVVPQGAGERPPQGPPPQVMVVQLDGSSRPFLQRSVVEMVPTTRTVQVKANGQVQEKQVVVPVPVMKEVRLPLDGPMVAVFGTDGKQIDPKELPKLLKKATPVLVSADGKKVDPFYLRIAREGTLVVVAQALATPPPPGPPLPPPPPPKEKVP